VDVVDAQKREAAIGTAETLDRAGAERCDEFVRESLGADAADFRAGVFFEEAGGDAVEEVGLAHAAGGVDEEGAERSNVFVFGEADCRGVREAIGNADDVVVEAVTDRELLRCGLGCRDHAGASGFDRHVLFSGRCRTGIGDAETEFGLATFEQRLAGDAAEIATDAARDQVGDERRRRDDFEDIAPEADITGLTEVSLGTLAGPFAGECGDQTGSDGVAWFIALSLHCCTSINCTAEALCRHENSALSPTLDDTKRRIGASSCPWRAARSVRDRPGPCRAPARSVRSATKIQLPSMPTTRKCRAMRCPCPESGIEAQIAMQGSVRHWRRLIPEILESVESVTAEGNLVAIGATNNRHTRTSGGARGAAGGKNRA